MDENPKTGEPTCDENDAPGARIDAPSSRLEVRTKDVQPSKPENDALAREGTAGNEQIEPNSPRLVHRDGVAFVEGCDVPVWRLEMARRAGSGPAALTAAFPGLTLSGVELAFDYACRHALLIEKLLERQGRNPSVIGSDDETDDASAFEAELDSLLDNNAEVFRRLAQ